MIYILQHETFKRAPVLQLFCSDLATTVGWLWLFSRTVQIESEHKVITTGPYQWIRHPAYTGMIAVNTGLSMAIGTWLGALTAFIFITASLLYRIHVEEKTLLTALGDEYREYMKRTWQLFPSW